MDPVPQQETPKEGIARVEPAQTKVEAKGGGVAADLLKSFFDKVVLGLVIFGAGWTWTNVIDADRTFWKDESDRLKAESELLVKLAPPTVAKPPDGSGSVPSGLHASAVIAIAKNGLNEANVIFCRSAPWYQKDPFQEWCHSQSGGDPPAAEYVARRAISPGRSGFYKAVLTSFEDDASQKEATSRAVDADYRRSQTRAAVNESDVLLNATSNDLKDPKEIKNKLTSVLAGVEAQYAAPISSSVQELALKLPTRLYVQVDDGATKEQVDKLRSRLKGVQDAKIGPLSGKGLIIPEFQFIAPAKMPRLVQMRYFYDSDRPVAQAVVDALHDLGPISLVEVPIPSPKNQIELWIRGDKIP